MSKRHSSSMNVHVLCFYYLLIWSSIFMPSYVQSQSDPRYLIIITTLMDDEVELEGNHHNKVSLSRHLYVYEGTDYYWCDWTGDTVVSGNHVDKHFPRSLAILFIIPLILFFISKTPSLSMIAFFFSRAAIMSSLFDKRYWFSRFRLKMCTDKQQRMVEPDHRLNIYIDWDDLP